jgi:hypothetical protein
MTTATAKRKVRPSSVDRIALCGASAHTENDEIVVDHEPVERGRIGTAAHAVLKDYLGRGLDDIPDLDPYAIEAGCSDQMTDLRIMAYSGRRFLREKGFRKFLSEEPILEERIEVDGPPVGGEDPTYYFSMQPDVLDYVLGEDGIGRLYVYDYKTGEEKPAKYVLGQLKSYAYGGLRWAEENGYQVDKIIVVVAWLRTGNEVVRKFSPSEILTFAEELPKIFEWDGKTYTPGSACRFCPRVVVCPEKWTMHAKGVEVFTDGPVNAIVPYKPGEIADPTKFARAIMQAKFLKDLIDGFLADSVIALRTHGGDISLPGGGRIHLKEQKGSSKLDGERLLDELNAYAEEHGHDPLTPEGVVELSKFSKDKVGKYLAALAPRGEKTKAKETFFERIEEEGVLTRGRPRAWVEVQGGAQ